MAKRTTEQSRKYNLAFRARRVAAGLCIKCKATMDCAGKMCSGCKRTFREAEAKKRSQRKLANLCGVCGKPSKEGLTLCAVCGAKVNAYTLRKFRAAKDQVVYHYSGGTMECVCCGEGERVVLQIDHKTPCGGSLRKMQGGTSGYFKRQLVRQGFPDRYQVLCSNCNWSKHVNGNRCHHQIQREAVYLPMIEALNGLLVAA